MGKKKTIEYLQAMMEKLRDYVPDWLWEQAHSEALPVSGGMARWRDTAALPAAAYNDTEDTVEKADGSHWVTIDGTHVLIGADGSATVGGKRIQLGSGEGGLEILGGLPKGRENNSSGETGPDKKAERKKEKKMSGRGGGGAKGGGGGGGGGKGGGKKKDNKGTTINIGGGKGSSGSPGSSGAGRGGTGGGSGGSGSGGGGSTGDDKMPHDKQIKPKKEKKEKQPKPRGARGKTKDEARRHVDDARQQGLHGRVIVPSEGGDWVAHPGSDEPEFTPHVKKSAELDGFDEGADGDLFDFIEKFNHNHDELGLFAAGEGGAGGQSRQRGKSEAAMHEGDHVVQAKTLKDPEQALKLAMRHYNSGQMKAEDRGILVNNPDDTYHYFTRAELAREAARRSDANAEMERQRAAGPKYDKAPGYHQSGQDAFGAALEHYKTGDRNKPVIVFHPPSKSSGKQFTVYSVSAMEQAIKRSVYKAVEGRKVESESMGLALSPGARLWLEKFNGFATRPGTQALSSQTRLWLEKYNHNHDERGRFAEGEGGSGGGQSGGGSREARSHLMTESERERASQSDAQGNLVVESKSAKTEEQAKREAIAAARNGQLKDDHDGIVVYGPDSDKNPDQAWHFSHDEIDQAISASEAKNGHSKVTASNAEHWLNRAEKVGDKEAADTIRQAIEGKDFHPSNVISASAAARRIERTERLRQAQTIKKSADWLEKFNHNHGSDGRFSEGQGGGDLPAMKPKPKGPTEAERRQAAGAGKNIYQVDKVAANRQEAIKLAQEARGRKLQTAKALRQAVIGPVVEMGQAVARGEGLEGALKEFVKPPFENAGPAGDKEIVVFGKDGYWSFPPLDGSGLFDSDQDPKFYNYAGRELVKPYGPTVYNENPGAGGLDALNYRQTSDGGWVHVDSLRDWEQQPDGTWKRKKPFLQGWEPRKVEKAEWSTAYQNDLNDSCFLYLEPGGEKDEEHKTTPRSLRHFPVRDAEGKLDLPHLRNAIARILQSNLGDELKATLQARARRLLERETARREMIQKYNHQHDERGRFASGEGGSPAQQGKDLRPVPGGRAAVLTRPPATDAQRKLAASVPNGQGAAESKHLAHTRQEAEQIANLQRKLGNAWEHRKSWEGHDIVTDLGPIAAGAIAGGAAGSFINPNLIRAVPGVDALAMQAVRTAEQGALFSDLLYGITAAGKVGATGAGAGAGVLASQALAGSPQRQNPFAKPDQSIIVYGSDGFWVFPPKPHTLTNASDNGVATYYDFRGGGKRAPRSQEPGAPLLTAPSLMDTVNARSPKHPPTPSPHPTPAPVRKSDGALREWLEKYNHNHGPDGKFSEGSGGGQSRPTVHVKDANGNWHKVEPKKKGRRKKATPPEERSGNLKRSAETGDWVAPPSKTPPEGPPPNIKADEGRWVQVDPNWKGGRLHKDYRPGSWFWLFYPLPAKIRKSADFIDVSKWDLGEKSVAICLSIPRDMADAVAITGGEKPEDLHLTLVYLGDLSAVWDNGELQRKLVDALWDVARGYAPLKAHISGYGVFGATSDLDADGEDSGVEETGETAEDQERVLYLTLDVPGLSRFQDYLAGSLQWGAGLKSPSEHGFQPHVTLAYLEPGQDPAQWDLEFPELEFELGDIALWVNDSRVVFPLMGEQVFKADPVEEAPAELDDSGEAAGDYWLWEIDVPSTKPCPFCQIMSYRQEITKAGEHPRQLKAPQSLCYANDYGKNRCTCRLVMSPIPADYGEAMGGVGAYGYLTHGDPGLTLSDFPAQGGRKKKVKKGDGETGRLGDGATTILKMDRARQIVYSVVLEPDTLDTQDDLISADEIEKACHYYLSTARVVKDYHGKFNPGPAAVEVIENFIAPCDFEVDGPYGRQKVIKGSWVMGVHVSDPVLWQKVERGEYTGFSVGGTGVREVIAA